MTLGQRIASAYRAFSSPVQNRYEGAETRTSQSTLTTTAQSVRFDVTKTTRLNLLKKARWFERNNAILNRLADLYEAYTVGSGLQLLPSSSDPVFNEEAQSVWDGWKPYCDLTSRQHFDTLQTTIARSHFVDGEVFVLLTRSANNRPRLQLIEGHRIFTPSNKSAGEGKTIVDGIDIDASGRPISYNVAKESEGQYASSSSEFLPAYPAEFVVHVYEPSRANQYRGLPMCYPVICDLHDLDDLQLLEMQAAKDAASIARVIKNQAGELSADELRKMRFSTPKTAQGQTELNDRNEYYRNVFGSEVKLLRTGDTMEQFSSNRPSVATKEYWNYLTSKICAGVGIPYVLVFPESMQGTVYRGALDMASAFFRARSMVFASAFQRIYEFVIDAELSRKPFDWRKTTWRPPRAVNVDVGRNSRAMIDELRVSARTLEDCWAEMGENWQRKMRQRASEIAYAKELAKEFSLSPDEILQLTGSDSKSVKPEEAGNTQKAEDKEDEV